MRDTKSMAVSQACTHPSSSVLDRAGELWAALSRVASDTESMALRMMIHRKSTSSRIKKVSTCDPDRTSTLAATPVKMKMTSEMMWDSAP